MNKEDLQGEPKISKEHVKNNQAIRTMLHKRGIRPEDLPCEEDIKEVEKRLEKDTKEELTK